jgi:hypothetical protein
MEKLDDFGKIGDNWGQVAPRRRMRRRKGGRRRRLSSGNIDLDLL